MALTKSDRELLELRFKTIEDRQKQQHQDLKGDLGEILSQVKLTNGRVTSLEKSRTWTKGAAWAFGALVSVVFGLLTYMGITLTEDVRDNKTFRLQHQQNTQQVK
jgi:hypothetical protein